MLPTSASSSSLQLGKAPARGRRTRRSSRWLRPDRLGLLLLAAAALIAVSLLLTSHAAASLPRVGRLDLERGSLRKSSRLLARSKQGIDRHTLVIYVYSGTDPEYAANLRFFLTQIQVSLAADIPLCTDAPAFSLTVLTNAGASFFHTAISRCVGGQRAGSVASTHDRQAEDLQLGCVCRTTFDSRDRCNRAIAGVPQSLVC